MSIEKVFGDMSKASNTRKLYDKRDEKIDESLREGVLIERLRYRLEHLEKRLTDLEARVKALEKGGKKK